MDKYNLLDRIENKYDINSIQLALLSSLISEAPPKFKQWLSKVDFETLDYPSFRLIPAVFHTFQDIKEGNPYYGRMKGIYRYYLFKNILLLTKGHPIIKQLIDAKIDFIVFNGAALTIKYYKNNAIRPMNNIDFLIHRKDFFQAADIFIKNNLASRYDNAYSSNYIDADSNSYILNWYSLPESLVDNIDSGIWHRARSFLWEGLNLKIMAPEDLILTNCINGVREAPIRYEWIYDLIKITQTESEILWDIINHEAKNRNLTGKMFDALHLAHSLSQTPMPSIFIDPYKEPQV